MAGTKIRMMNDRENVLSVDYVEQLYAAFMADRHRVSAAWQEYFDHLEGDGVAKPGRTGPSFRPASIFNPPAGGNGAATGMPLRLARLQERVDLLVRNYRVRGHIIAKVDPLGRLHSRPVELDPGYYGFTEADLDCGVSTRTIRGSNVQTLRQIIERLEETYCGAIGAQFMHIDDLEARDWLQQRLEDSEHRLKLDREQQVRILTKLTDAVIFEEFIRTKYVGAKTFSLEGAETLIPLLDMAIEKLARQGVREIVMGMSHRGRLNVLANIIGKKYHDYLSRV